MANQDDAQLLFEQIASGHSSQTTHNEQVYQNVDLLDDGDVELDASEYELVQIHEQPNDDDDDFDDDEDYEPTVKKKTKAQRAKINQAPFSGPMLSLEEQQEIEEPVEIDLRDVYKRYGINPIEHELVKRRKKNLKKLQSSDIVELSIGEANFKCASGKREEAERLLYEVIRTHPLSAPLYDALGKLYYSNGDYQKSLDFYLIASGVGKKDSVRWTNIAEVAMKLEFNNSALNFYSRALRLDIKNISLYFKKCHLLETMKHYSEAVKLLERLLNMLENDVDAAEQEFKMIFSIMFRIARLQVTNLDKYKPALKMVENHIKQYNVEHDPERLKIFLSSHVDSYFDILNKNQLYFRVVLKCFQYGVLEAPSEFADFEYTCELNEDQKNKLLSILVMNLDSIQVPTLYHAVKTKLFSTLMHLERIDFVEEYADELHTLQDEKQIQRIFPSFIESLISSQKYSPALKLVEQLLEIPVSTQDSRFWYWKGICLANQEYFEEAIETFERAIQLDKNNFDAMNQLSIICNRIGDPQRALNNVTWQLASQDGGTGEDVVDFKRQFNRCGLLYTCKRWADFLGVAEELLTNEMIIFENWREVHQIIRLSGHGQGLVSRCRRFRKQKLKTMGKKLLTKMTPEQFFDLWKKTVFTMFYFTRERERALMYSFSGVLSVHFPKLEIPMIICILRFCIDSKFENYAYGWCTYLIKMFPTSGSLWYAFSVVMNDIYTDFRHKRFAIRLWRSLNADQNNNANVVMMNGIIALLNGRYRFALAIFLVVYRMRGTDQEFKYDSFYIALAYLHLLMQPHNRNKCSLFAQMVSFFDDYAFRTGRSQETYYNLGRAFHQLGFLQHAIGFYNCALKTPLKIFDPRFDLAPEIAFNLAQIYRKIERHGTANQLMLKYCTI